MKVRFWINIDTRLGAVTNSSDEDYVCKFWMNSKRKEVCTILNEMVPNVEYESWENNLGNLIEVLTDKGITRIGDLDFEAKMYYHTAAKSKLKEAPYYVQIRTENSEEDLKTYGLTQELLDEEYVLEETTVSSECHNILKNAIANGFELPASLQNSTVVEVNVEYMDDWEIEFLKAISFHNNFY